jgi:hypothetical protein
MEQISKLVLYLTAKDANPGNGRTSKSASQNRTQRQDFAPRCAWCDSLEHRKFQCPDLADALRSGRVRYSDNYRIVNAATGEEIPTMFGRGGMKAHFEQKTGISANNSNIMVEPYGDLGGDNTVCHVVLDADGNVIQKFTDADVEEKRKRDEGDLARNV